MIKIPVNKKLKAKFDEVSDKLEDISARERGLVLMGVCALVFVLHQLVIGDSFRIKEKLIKEEIYNIEDKIVELNTRSEQIFIEHQNNPNKKYTDQIDVLGSELDSMDNELKSITDKLIEPDKMASMVKELLLNTKGLVLVRLEGLPAEMVQDYRGLKKAGAVVNQSGSKLHEQEENNLYRHGLVVELEGGYKDFLSYLDVLESLPWKIYWEKVDYQVGEYPTARIVLRLFTLSTKEAWIGV